MKITREWLIERKPCWGTQKIDAYARGRDYVDSSEVLADSTLHTEDRLWMAIELMDDRQCRTFTRDCAVHAMDRSQRRAALKYVVMTLHRWLSGSITDAQLAMARESPGYPDGYPGAYSADGLHPDVRTAAWKTAAWVRSELFAHAWAAQSNNTPATWKRTAARNARNGELEWQFACALELLNEEDR